jgi:hypothetical protein
MTELSISTPKSFIYKIKEFVIKMSLFTFGVTFEMVSKHSEELQKEISNWEEGRAFSLGIVNGGPAMTVQKVNGRIKFLGMDHINPKLTIYFKNVEGALLVFTGQIGSHMAFIDHRAYLHGNLGEAVQTARAMNVVQKYLFPSLILNKTFKVPPTFTFSQLMLKGRIYLTLVFGLALNLGKLF